MGWGPVHEGWGWGRGTPGGGGAGSMGAGGERRSSGDAKGATEWGCGPLVCACCSGQPSAARRSALLRSSPCPLCSRSSPRAVLSCSASTLHPTPTPCGAAHPHPIPVRPSPGCCAVLCRALPGALLQAAATAICLLLEVLLPNAFLVSCGKAYALLLSSVWYCALARVLYEGGRARRSTHCGVQARARVCLCLKKRGAVSIRIGLPPCSRWPTARAAAIWNDTRYTYRAAHVQDAGPHPVPCLRASFGAWLHSPACVQHAMPLPWLLHAAGARYRCLLLRAAQGAPRGSPPWLAWAWAAGWPWTWPRPCL